MYSNKKIANILIRNFERNQMGYIQTFFWLPITNKEIFILPTLPLWRFIGSRCMICCVEKDFAIVPRMEENNWFAMSIKDTERGSVAHVLYLCHP